MCMKSSCASTNNVLIAFITANPSLSTMSYAEWGNPGFGHDFGYSDLNFIGWYWFGIDVFAYFLWVLSAVVFVHYVIVLNFISCTLYIMHLLTKIVNLKWWLYIIYIFRLVRLIYDRIFFCKLQFVLITEKEIPSYHLCLQISNDYKYK